MRQTSPTRWVMQPGVRDQNIKKRSQFSVDLRPCLLELGAGVAVNFHANTNLGHCRCFPSHKSFSLFKIRQNLMFFTPIINTMADRFKKCKLWRVGDIGSKRWAILLWYFDGYFNVGVPFGDILDVIVAKHLGDNTHLLMLTLPLSIGFKLGNQIQLLLTT